jgi:hypothetical protein
MEKKMAKSAELNKSMLIVVLTLFAITVVISFIPIVKYVLYPFKLFSTFVHESCHGLAAIATGGKWLRFTVGADGSGLAWTAGGWRSVIIPAGYLGCALLGGILLKLGAHKTNVANVILTIMGIALVTITLIFARNTVAIIVGIGFGLFLGIVGLKMKGFFPALLLNYLAVNLSLNALLDVKTLFLHTAANAGRNDAVAMHNEIWGIGGMTWAIIFVLSSILITYGFLRSALKVKEKDPFDTRLA